MTGSSGLPVREGPIEGLRGRSISVCDCGSTESRQLADVPERRYGMPGRFTLLACGECGLVRTNPQPENLAEYYPDDDYYSYRPPAPPTPRVRARFQHAYGSDRGRRAAARIAGRWLSQGMPPGPPGTILDVGCGSGGFLLALQTAGWDVHGVELSATAVEAAHRAGLDGVVAGDLVDTEPDQEYDAIRFWHTLEHVHSPRAQLDAARLRLKRGGALIVGVPNFGSLLSHVGGQDWFYLDVPRHLWHFQRRTLAELVEGAGFRVRSLRVRSTSTALLGTIDYRMHWGERLLGSRKAWYAALPVEATLDVARLGDGLELIATNDG
jgi:SAM-dependent methyltransferase